MSYPVLTPTPNLGSYNRTAGSIFVGNSSRQGAGSMIRIYNFYSQRNQSYQFFNSLRGALNQK